MPMRLPDVQSNEAKQAWALVCGDPDSEVLSVRMKLGTFAPPGIVERLMSSCYGLGTYHKFWKRGALIETEDTSLLIELRGKNIGNGEAAIEFEDPMRMSANQRAALQAKQKEKAKEETESNDAPRKEFELTIEFCGAQANRTSMWASLAQVRQIAQGVIDDFPGLSVVSEFACPGASSRAPTRRRTGRSRMRRRRRCDARSAARTSRCRRSAHGGQGRRDDADADAQGRARVQVLERQGALRQAARGVARPAQAARPAGGGTSSGCAPSAGGRHRGGDGARPARRPAAGPTPTGSVTSRHRPRTAAGGAADGADGGGGGGGVQELKAPAGVDAGRSDVRLSAFLAEPIAAAAGLHRVHVLALRLSSSVYKSVNRPLHGGCSPGRPHPYPALVIQLVDALARLRVAQADARARRSRRRRPPRTRRPTEDEDAVAAVAAAKAEHEALREDAVFWRGVYGLAADEFKSRGGTEIGFLSSSRDRSVAQKAALEHAAHIVNNPLTTGRSGHGTAGAGRTRSAPRWRPARRLAAGGRAAAQREPRPVRAAVLLVSCGSPRTRRSTSRRTSRPSPSSRRRRSGSSRRASTSSRKRWTGRSPRGRPRRHRHLQAHRGRTVHCRLAPPHDGRAAGQKA